MSDTALLEPAITENLDGFLFNACNDPAQDPFRSHPVARIAKDVKIIVRVHKGEILDVYGVDGIESIENGDPGNPRRVTFRPGPTPPGALAAAEAIWEKHKHKKPWRARSILT